MPNRENENLASIIKETLTESPNPKFIFLLEQRLISKAPEHLCRKSFFNPLSMFFRFSKSPSAALIASVLIITILGGTIFYTKQNGPQEILNKAYAYYETETQKDSIYYEKTHYQAGSENYIREVWYDNIGNNLFLESDPATGEITYADLVKIDESGRAKIYDTFPQEEDVSIQPVQALLEDNFYCVEFYEEGKMKHNTTLMISAQDRNIYSLSGWGEEIDPEVTDEQKIEGMIGELESGKSNPQQTKLIIETLQKTKNLRDQKITENDKEYQVFTMDLNSDIEIHYYINLETYRLEKMTETLNSTKETVFTMEYLESHYLDNSQAENIFDPTKYGLHPSQTLEAGNPLNLTEDGCYKTNGDKMTAEEEKAFWATLPSSAKTDMEEFKKDIIQNYASNSMSADPLEIQDDAIDLGLNLEAPLKGGISQSFHSDHSGIDFASMLFEEPVLAADDGIVSFVSSNNSWNGGRQNTVIIDHGDGIQTLYSKLGIVNVQKGDKLKKGDKIATVKEGDGNGFIHFELLLNGESVNPQETFSE